MNGNHRLDATTILQGDRLTVEKRKALIKLGFYLICFFLYLYRYVCLRCLFIRKIFL